MDGLSVASAAFEIAHLAHNVYSYIQSVHKAERWFTPIAGHVKLTAVVLESVATILKDEDVRKECTPALVKSTDGALQGCRKAFEDLDVLVRKLCGPEKGGAVTLTLVAKTTMAFRQSELNMLQAHLERFKSSLDLVIGVLNLAMAMRNRADQHEIQRLRVTAAALINVERHAKVEEERVSAPVIRGKERAASMSERSLSRGPVANRQERKAMAAEIQPAHSDVSLLIVDGLGSGRAHPQERASSEDHASNVYSAAREKPKQSDELLVFLKLCAEAVSELTAGIEQATTLWEADGVYRQQSLSSTFHATRKAVQDLHSHELGLSFDSNGRHYALGRPHVTVGGLCGSSLGYVPVSFHTHDGRTPQTAYSNPQERPMIPDYFQAHPFGAVETVEDASMEDVEEDAEDVDDTQEQSFPVIPVGHVHEMSLGPTPPAHGPSRLSGSRRHPNRQRLATVPEPDIEPDYFYSGRGRRPSTSPEEREMLSREELFQQVEDAVMGASAVHAPSISASQAQIERRWFSHALSYYSAEDQVNGHLHSVATAQQYDSDSDSDAEAAQGLALMQEADADKARRRLRGRDKTPLRSGSGSQRASKRRHLMDGLEVGDLDDYGTASKSNRGEVQGWARMSKESLPSDSMRPEPILPLKQESCTEVDAALSVVDDLLRVWTRRKV